MVSLNLWFCWILPFIGAVSVIPASKVNSRFRDAIAVAFPTLSFVMAVIAIRKLLVGYYGDEKITWIIIPNASPLNFGILVDPLSIILANIVSFIGCLVAFYSLSYMREEYGLTRYWFMINFFIGGMLLLVLADNLITMLIGWKIVGLCSYALIGHYIRDEREHWVGGPMKDFYEPTHCGLKALVMTSIGDIFMISGIMLIYAYSRTFNFLELYRTASQWMNALARTPGLLALTSVLLSMGPIGKSAQFPLHEWLPEAMAGPTPVSALIHAATMVKAGVYFVARILPIFYFGYHVLGLVEASTFFTIIALTGAFTAFLAGTQAIISLELKKALAYSTMSQIGYMMLGLGSTGLSNLPIEGYTASILHLMAHALFKASLFLCAGSVIKACKSIYMSDMGGLWRKMPITWVCMWISALSLIGVPPLPGFWSKDAIIAFSLETGLTPLAFIALVTTAITAFYTIRLIGLTFHGTKRERVVVREAEKIMWVPYVILSVTTIVIGGVMPIIQGVFAEKFKVYFLNTYYAASIGADQTISVHQNYMLTAFSLILIVFSSIIAYVIYIKPMIDAKNLIEEHYPLRILWNFLWNRWYINKAYYITFVNPFSKFRILVLKLENLMDITFNVRIPSFFVKTYLLVRRIQTGILTYNMLYVVLFMSLAILILMLMVVGL